MASGYIQHLDERQAENFVYKFFRNPIDTDSTTSLEMNVNGETTSVNFDVPVPEGERYIIRRVNPVILATGYAPDKFGGLDALTEGLRIVVIDLEGNEIFDFYDGETLKQNADWVPLVGVDNDQERTAALSVIGSRWTIRRGGANLWLPPQHRLRFIVQDDLTGLQFFRIMAQGQLFKER